MTTTCDDEVRILTAVAQWHDGVLSNTELLEALDRILVSGVRVVVGSKLGALLAAIFWTLMSAMAVAFMFKPDSSAVVSPKIDLLFNVGLALLSVWIIYRNGRKLLN